MEEKAKRGELIRLLAPGYVCDLAGTIVKDPNLRVQEAIAWSSRNSESWEVSAKPIGEWVEGVAYLFRYREVSWQANSRYLDALAVVDNQAKRDLDRVTTPKKNTAGRGCSGFNPLVRPDTL